MVFAKLKGNELVFELTQEQLKELELDPEKSFELVKAKKGVWVLVESEKKPRIEIDEMEQKIIGLIKKTELKERVEGEFEKLLSPSEQIKLSKMVGLGKVNKFKLSEKYKKAVYKLPEEETREAKQFELKEKEQSEYNLEQDGFMVAKTEFAAQQLSSLLAEKIKSGEVKGTRSFSGEFFIVDTSLLAQKSAPVLEFLKAKKNATLQELLVATSLPPTLIRIICTFLSEDGLILERRKEQYVFIQ